MNVSTDKFQTLKQELLDALREKDENSDVRKVSTDSQLRRLIKLQEEHAEEAKRRKAQEAAAEVSREEHRRKVIRQILAIASGIVVVAGGGTVTYTQLNPAPEKPTTVDVVERVDKAAEQTAEQVGSEVQTLGDRVETLEDIATDQQIEIEATQVQLVEGIDYIGQKIDEAHPRQAGKIPEPPSLKAAKKRKHRDEVRERLLEDNGE